MFILLNKCYGGFGLSDQFLDTYPEYEDVGWNEPTTSRTDEELINRIRGFGIARAEGNYANLSIVSIPDDVTDWRIRRYDGYEYVEYVKDGKIYDA